MTHRVLPSFEERYRYQFGLAKISSVLAVWGFCGWAWACLYAAALFTVSGWYTVAQAFDQQQTDYLRSTEVSKN